MSALQTFNNLPPWAKGIIAVGGLAGIAFGTYKLVKFVNDMAIKKEEKKETDTAADEARQLEKQGVKPTLSKSQLETIANQIQTALNGATEDEQAIYAAFANVKNNVDLLNLKSVFGTRQTGYYFWSTFNGTLSQQITHYFNSAEIKALNDMLSRKGITHRF